MEKLIKPAEYAQELGISRQAVYAKIKRGILKSKNVEGKLYIVVDNTSTTKQTTATKKINNTEQVNTKESTSKKDYKALLQAKDETIAVLKETVVDLKESNKQISTTLRGEIDLLKDAFHEMRTMYVRQLEHKETEALPDMAEEEQEHHEEEAIEIFPHEEVLTQEVKAKWISVKKFFKLNDITKEKQQQKILKRLKKAYKKGDQRVIKLEDKLKMNAYKTYEDILN